MAKKHQLTTSDYLEYPEYEKLLQGLRKDKEYFWELYARLSFCTACRASDILALQWDEILNKTDIVVVEKKTRKARKLMFNKSVREKIRELHILMEQPDTDNYIFVNPETGRPITVQRVNQKLKELKYRYAIKIAHFSTHTFRKTFGRYVYEKYERSAESLILLNKIFNHSSIQATKAYIGITQDEVNKVYNSIVF